MIIAFAILVGTLGTLSNQLVMFVNDGKMPVKVFVETGVLEDDMHQQMTESTKLNFLGDVILITTVSQDASLFRKILASEHPVKIKLWGEGMGICPTNEMCIASIGDIMRWTFALLMSIFFGPFVFAAFHELWKNYSSILNRRKQ